MHGLALVLAIVLLPAIVVVGCGPTAPSDEQIRQAILEYVHEYTNWTLFGGRQKPYTDVYDVDSIRVGKSYKISDGVNDIDVWPVNAYLLWPTGSKVQGEFDIAQDPYGDWMVIQGYLPE